MAEIMDPILPILSILGYWAIILGSFGGQGMCLMVAHMKNEVLEDDAAALDASHGNWHSKPPGSNMAVLYTSAPYTVYHVP